LVRYGRRTAVLSPAAEIVNTPVVVTETRLIVRRGRGRRRREHDPRPSSTAARAM